MDFYRRMELVCSKIPYGKAATYGQIAMLEAEGIMVSAENRVDLKKDGWKNTLEEVRELRMQFEQLGI